MIDVSVYSLISGSSNNQIMPQKKKVRIGRRPKSHSRHKKDVQLSPAEDCEDFDTFMRTCLRNTTESDSCLPDSKKVEDSDGFSADEFYVVINKPVKYSVEDNVDSIIEREQTKAFNHLLEHSYRSNFTKFRGSSSLRLVQIYDSDIPKLKLCVSVNRDFCVKIAVHDKLLPSSHMIWEMIPRYCPNVGAIDKVLDAVEKFKICTGNDEPELQNLIPMRNVHETATGQMLKGYRETHTKQTVRSVNCNFLVEKNSRCKSCAVYRKTLFTLKRRKSSKGTISLLYTEDISSIMSSITCRKSTQANCLSGRTVSILSFKIMIISFENCTDIS